MGWGVARQTKIQARHGEVGPGKQAGDVRPSKQGG